MHLSLSFIVVRSNLAHASRWDELMSYTDMPRLVSFLTVVSLPICFALDDLVLMALKKRPSFVGSTD